MIYVVSGYRRTGTSCMVRALHHGGLPVITKPKELNNEFVRDRQGRPLNPSGVYEVGHGIYMSPDFLRSIPDNHLVKIFFDGLPLLPQAQYKIIFMIRAEEDINASLANVDTSLRAAGVRENPPFPKPFDVYRPYKQEDIDHVVNICEVRADMQLTKVHFNDLVDDPVGTLESLELPIDIQKAAAVIDPKHQRFRHDRSSRRDAGINPRTADSTSPT